LSYEFPEDITFGAWLRISIAREAISCATNKRLPVNHRSTWRVAENGDLNVQRLWQPQIIIVQKRDVLR
jgi:hypothetical protein